MSLSSFQVNFKIGSKIFRLRSALGRVYMTNIFPEMLHRHRRVPLHSRWHTSWPNKEKQSPKDQQVRTGNIGVTGVEMMWGRRLVIEMLPYLETVLYSLSTYFFFKRPVHSSVWCNFFVTRFSKKITWIFKELCLCWFSSKRKYRLISPLAIHIYFFY